MDLKQVASEIVNKAVKQGAGQAEASVFMSDEALTRFTKNMIHQNVASKQHYLNLEVVVDGNKKGTSGVNSLEAVNVDKAIEAALKIARVSSPDPEFKSFVEPKPIAPLKGVYVKATTDVTPEDRARAVKTVIETAMDYSSKVNWSAGSYTVDVTEFAIANTLGVEASTKTTSAVLEVNTRAGPTGQDSSGFASRLTKDARELDFEEAALSAAKDAVNGIGPKTLDLGEYEAILPPEAVSTFTGYIGMLGFSAKAYQEGYSFLTDMFGSKVFDEKLNIVDDGRSLKTYDARPFDGEGTPKQALSLIEDGVPQALCYDNYTARKDGTESTGHARPKSNRGFYYRGVPVPVNQIVKPGDASVEEMIEDTKRGVILSRLHYVNPIRRDKAVISGLTRDAAWYIENGEIKYPIKVMRFTDAVARVFGSIDAIGDESTVRKVSSVTTPAVKVSSLRFTGQSQF